MNRKVLFAAALLGLVGSSAHAQPRMTVVGGVSPADLSADGNIMSAIRVNNLVRWNRGGTPALQVLPGAQYQGGAPSLSADGSIVSGMVDNSGGLGGLPTDSYVAARWTDLSGSWQTLPLVPSASICGSSINTPFNISANGRFIVGGTWVNIDDNDCRFRGYVYDSVTGASTNLGNAGGVANESSRANDVTADGSIIVGFDESPTNGGRRPALWVNTGSGYVEQILPTTGDSETEGGEIFAINDEGTVMVGQSLAYTTDGYPNLVKWTNSGGTWTAHDLGTMPANPSWCELSYTIAGVSGADISSDGNLIVGFATYANGGERVTGAIIWTPELGIVDLYDYLNSQGTVGLAENFPSPPYDVNDPYNGYPVPSLGYATACTPDGRTIIGGGFAEGITSWMVDLDGHSCVAPVMSSQPSDNSGVFGGTAYLNAGAIGSSPMTATWYKNGVAVYQGTTNLSQYQAPAMTCDDGAEYWVTFTNPCGSVTSEHYTLTVCGACNLAGQCSQMSQYECMNGGGFWQGPGSACINPACKPNLTATSCLGPTDLLQFLNLYFTNYDGHGSAVPGDNQTIPDLNPLSPIYAVPCTPSDEGVYPVIPASGLKADYDGDCQVGPTDLLGYLHDYFNPASECFGSCPTTLVAPSELSAGSTGSKALKERDSTSAKVTPAARR